MKSIVVVILFHAVGFWSALAADAPDFSAGVRTTEPLSAAEELKSFMLPDGFKISLFSEESEIAKPMNMAFDSRGRLWVTSSLEYPYAAPADRKAKDTLRVLEDTNGDGRADKVTTFADNLNIPIGVYPFNGGASALVWSIPNIWRLDDTDGDGVADRREILFGPIGEAVDTHGMQNGFTRAYDGWVYVCHGFRNESVVRANDGSVVRLQSGNTYRFRLDGSQIEQFTWGQVNPFGMCLDPLGNHYTADCHSSPIYQLICGGYYPSFGKPHDGLGFAPLLMQHAHGSTALCGVTYYSADSNWPDEFRDTLFVGNVMTSRVHRDKVEFHGASPRAIEKPEFLTSSDPWFRPVDIQMGPDGALYIADFYNRIIGHYEVPLTHPGRDRYRGRIWRVTYEGGEPFRKFDSLADASMQEFIERLGDPNLTARLLAMHELCDRFGADAAAPVSQILKNSRSAEQRVAALWVLERLGTLNASDLARAIAEGGSRMERVHALKIAGEINELPLEIDTAAVVALGDADPFIVRQAGEMLGRHPNVRNIPILVSTLQQLPDADDHTSYVMKRALRSQFNESGAFTAFDSAMTGARDNEIDALIASIAGSIPSSDAADFLVRYLARSKSAEPAFFQHAARFVSRENLSNFIQQVRGRFADNLSLQADLYQSIETGLGQRGQGTADELTAWAEELANGLLSEDTAQGWTLLTSGEGGAPWVQQQRMAKGSQQAVAVVSSLPTGGESLTGVLRSQSFEIPAKLTLHLCGHDGYPDKPAKGLNYVMLRDAANDAEIARVPAPRGDAVIDRELDLKAYAGRKGYLELVDGDKGDAFAWIGFAGATPAVVKLPTSSLREDTARLRRGIALVQRWHFPSAMEAVAALAGDRSRDAGLRAAALKALVGEPSVSMSGKVLAETDAPAALVAEAVKGLANHGAATFEESQIVMIARAIASLPARLQREVTTVLADKRGELLLAMVESGQVGSPVLVDAAVQNALEKSSPKDWQKRLEAATRNVPSDLDRLQALALKRFEQWTAASPDGGSAKRGSEIFTMQCMVCHQVGGKGNLIGPQLDGVGKRGTERLLEDIINPNRNVDHAFQLSFVTLKNGETKAGLFRREEGPTLVFADTAGKEFSVVASDVANRNDTGLSLMPPIYGDALTAEQIIDLISYLSTK